tara:strand:- start:647 stop:796 length:150 start_codon:yes stop_codon:yes gene_type:complete
LPREIQTETSFARALQSDRINSRKIVGRDKCTTGNGERPRDFYEEATGA